MPPPKKTNALSLLRWLMLMAIPAIWCVLDTFEISNGKVVVAPSGALGFLENRTVDLRFRARGERDAPVKLIYVDIDTDAIQQYKWPWNPSRYAQLIDALFDRGHVKAVGFDLVFSENSRADFGINEQNQGRRLFGRAIAKYKNVVLAANYVPGPGTLKLVLQFPFVFEGATDPAKNDVPERPSFPIIGPSWGTIGLIDTFEGEARLAPFFADTPLMTFYPLSLQLALMNWGVGTEAITRFPDHMDVRRPDGTLLTRIPLLRGQLVEVNWYSRWISPKNPRFGVGDIGDYLTQLESADPAKQARGREFFAQFQDAIVLVGPVDQLLQDLARTPFDKVPVPQVGFHGNLLKTLTSGEYLRHLPRGLEIGIIFALTLAVSSLIATGGRRGGGFKTAGAVLTLAYVGAAFYLFSHNQLILPLVAPVGAVFTTSFAAIGWQLIEEERQKGRIKGMFGTYVSPQLVNRMIESGESPQLGGHDEEITAYFSDIQAFSTFSEALESGPLVELMNEYLTACTEIVQEEGGTLDKYIGDAVVAMFGAPIPVKDHAYRACVATQRVHRKLAELRDKWKGEGEKWPEIVWGMQTRIGLNTGVCTIGNMGSRTRFNYTMMGDNVNVAARMESGAKTWGTYTMCAESTKLACEQHGGDRVVFRALGRIEVKGRSKPVPIFEIVGLKESLVPGARECIGFFEQGLARFYARDWTGAIGLFRQSAEYEPNQPGATLGVKTNPSLVYLEIADSLRQEPPPENWNGVYVMKEK